MIKTEQMQDLHKKVWTFRASMADVWPTPDTLDSLRFAFTEAGEAMDAYLRTKGGYARNNVKEPDLFGELADCALMLFTALGPDFKMRGLTRRTLSDAGRPQVIDLIAAHAAGVLSRYTMPRLFHLEGFEMEQWLFLANDLAYLIYAMPGMDLAAELDKRMIRIAAKHGRTYAATGSA